MSGIPEKKLRSLYLDYKQSAKEVSATLLCSENKVNYWLKKYGIPKRSVSEAIYVKANPEGDPFSLQKPRNTEEAFLYGLGIGLYWGEGTKANKHTIRLGNTDPRLIKKFIEFLKKVYRIDQHKLKFGLQIFSDMSPKKAQEFWMKKLNANEKQFQKVVVTPTRGVGNYRNKTKHGVLTAYFNNKKLRDIIVGTIEDLE